MSVTERPPWPVLAESTISELATAIDGAARRTRRKFDDLPLEERLTGNFFGRLDDLEHVQTPSGDTIGFNYTTFRGTTEREVGADGAMILSVRAQDRVLKKVLLFQAKRLPGEQSRTQLEIRRLDDRDRLLRQLDDQYEVAGHAGSIGLFYSRGGFYAVDGGTFLSVFDRDESILRNPLRRAAHPWTIGRCIARLAFTCKIGNTDAAFIEEVERDGLKDYARKRRRLRHRLDVTVNVAPGTTAPDNAAGGRHYAASGPTAARSHAHPPMRALPVASSAYVVDDDVVSDENLESESLRRAFARTET